MCVVGSLCSGVIRAGGHLSLNVMHATSVALSIRLG
jgi:hypothetical protein